MNKQDELKQYINQHDPDIIQFTELFPKNCKKDKLVPRLEFDIPGYIPFINEDPKRGIIVYIKSTIDATEITTRKYNSIENVFLSVKINSRNILLGCVYRSPI